MTASTLLIVEDNVATRKMMRVALQVEGYSVLEAEDGATALHLAKTRTVSLALLDCKLPDMDGFAVASRLRQIAPDLPMLAISGWARGEDPRIVSAGFLEMLVKPLEPCRLVEAVARHLPKSSILQPGRGRRLLLADDDPSQRKLGLLYLRSAGFEVSFARGGEEALRMALGDRPDAIVSDVMMPRMDGFALTRAVRAEPYLASTPVVLVSAHYVEPEDRALAAKLGAAAYVSRADGFDALVTAAVSALDAPRGEDFLAAHDDAQGDYVRRIAHQLDRQTSLGAGLARRASLQATALTVLEKLSSSLSKQLDPENALGHTLAECLDAAGLSVGAVLLTSEAETMTVAAQVGSPAEVDWGRHAKLFGRAIRRGGLLLPLHDAALEDRDFLRELGLGSALIVPIVARDAPMGVIVLGSNGRELAGVEGDSFLGAAQTVSAQLGQALALGRTFAKLSRAEQRYRTILENARDVIAVSSLDGVLLESNHATETLTGLPRADLIGKRLIDFVPNEGQAAWQEEWAQAVLRGTVTIPAARFARPDGTVVTAELTRTVIDLGDEQCMLTIGRDITSRLKLEEQLRQALKMDAIGSFAGGIAHDFNNLLSVVIAYSKMAIEQLRPGDPLRTDLEQIHRAGERATDLTRQLLAFSREQIMNPTIFDLNVVVLGMEPMLRCVLGDEVELSILTSGRAGKVYADPGQIERVIMNLVINARDAMPEGGKLTLQTADVDVDASDSQVEHGLAPGPYELLVVTDTGEGMDAATRERIFEPFFTTKDVGKGTGLGLAMVLGIVKQSEGHVSVHSEPGKKGTTFKIYLPRRDGQATAPTPSLQPSAGARGTDRILLVEDDEQVRALARTILTRGGYTVLEAQNAGEALLVCEQDASAIDLLVTDVVMPRVSGKQLSDRLKALRPGLKTLFMSGYDDDLVARHGIIAAGLAFLEKPITPEALLTKVRDVLGVPASQPRPL